MTAVPSGERTIGLSHTIQTAAAAASAPSTPIPASPAPSEPRVRGGATAGAAIVAPAGYGKTTLLSQWAERDSRPFAWVTLDDRDNDPVVLLRHIAAALSRDEPVGQRVIDALNSPAPSIWTAVVPRLAAELSARSPIVLVLDDFNLLRSRAALDAVSALIDDEAEGSMFVAS